MKKRIISFLLVMALVLSMSPMVTIEAEATTNLPADIYLQQQTGVTCTLASAAMMLRARMYLSDNNGWRDITESAIKSSAWVTAGLLFSWSYSLGRNSMKVGHKFVSGISVADLKALLDLHEEGIVLYCGYSPHAVFLTDYEGNMFYCADPADGYSQKRIALADSLLGARYGSQAAVLQNMTAYWYIESYSIESTGYLSKCTPYPCSVELKITEDCCPYTLPCNNNTAQEFGYTSTKLEDKKLYAGATVTATALYKNTNAEDHYWYKVILADGSSAYLYSTHAVKKELIKPWIENGSFPSQITGATPLEGTIKTYGTMTEIRASVYKGYGTGGTPVLESSSGSISTKSYSLSGNKVDNDLWFQNLANTGEGYYTLAYEVAFAESYYAENNTLKTEPARCVIIEEYNFYYGKSVVECNHSYGAWVTVSAASCTSDGMQKRTCSKCGEMVTQTVPALGHNYVGHTVDATCTQYGYVVYTCVNCGDSYETGSGYSEWSTTYPSGVDASRIESRTEYRYQNKNFTTAATEVLDGWTYYGMTTQWSDWGEWSVWSNTAVTASESIQVEEAQVWGYYYYPCWYCGTHCPRWDQCLNCGKTAEKGKNPFTVVWSTTSGENANLQSYIYMGVNFYSTYIDGQLVFKWSDGGQKTTGYRYRARSLETVYQFYQWSGWSDWSADAVSASDTVNVETRTVYRYALGELAAHQYGAWVEIQAGSCTQATVLQRACVHCGHYETQETPAPGHSYNAVITAPTCTENGYTTYTCSVCGDSCVDNEMAPMGHTEEILPGKEPTCVESGLTDGTICSVCGEILVAQEEIMSPYHGYEAVVTAPTCTEEGYTTYTCLVCGDSYVSDSVEALGHNYNSVVTEPTYTSQGYTTHTCTRCDDSYVDSYTGPLVPETDVKVTVGTVSGMAGDTVEVYLTLENAPELKSLAISGLAYDTEHLTLVSGEWLQTGSVLSNWDPETLKGVHAFGENMDLNGDVFKLTFIINEDAPAGVYEIRCQMTAKQRQENGSEQDVPVAMEYGAVEVMEYAPGDVDGNEFVTTDDAIYLLYYVMFGGEDYPVNQECDFDGNGFVTTDDAIYLLYHIMFGEEDYPLH